MSEVVANDLQVPPASARNAGPILEVLKRVLTPPSFSGTRLLEIAAGAGYHAAIFAKAFPKITWQPTDLSPEARTSIAAHVAAAQLANLCPPLALDVCDATWPVAETDAVLCINMIHISPWEATEGLFKGAARLMPRAGLVVTYGPYAIDGDFLAESNVAFDQSLRLRNASWGIRDLKDVTACAAAQGLRHDETVRMPANNLMLVFRKS